MDLSQNFCGLELTNPLVLASGILGTTGASLARVARLGAGAVTMKSVWLKAHPGYKNPTVLELGGGNLINAVGLPHGGIKEAELEIQNFRQLSTKPLFVSLAARTKQEFQATAERVRELEPNLVELDLSCPHVVGSTGRPLACEARATQAVIRVVKKVLGKIPLAAKLSQNVLAIAPIAQAVEAGGGDVISAINSVGPGLVLDIETAQPILANRFGGLSGPGIRPLAVKAVFEIYQAVKLPIIGGGGVSNLRDVIEMFLAGATLVSLGSIVYRRGPKVFQRLTRELAKWGAEQGYKKVTELIGKAHRQ